MQDTNFLPQRILCVAAHADDNEFCFGGSIAHWSQSGSEIAYVICSDGSRGAKNAQTDRIQLASTRSDEQKNACSILGVNTCYELGLSDGELQKDQDKITAEIVKYIRTFKPDTVLCIDPTFYYSKEYNYVNHIDHRVVGEATFNAVYPMARDALFFTEHLQSGLEPHIVENLLMFNLNDYNFIQDISTTLDTKVEAMMCHTSQVSDQVLVAEMLRDMAHTTAKGKPYTYGESFVRIRLRGA